MRARPEKFSMALSISDLAMLHDLDADYSPKYVKVARILCDKSREVGTRGKPPAKSGANRVPPKTSSS
jgi:hypothetical protein